MAINPINVSRVSQNMLTESMIATLQSNQRSLFRTQSQIASGRSYVSPSDDPVAAARTLDLTQVLGRQRQFVQNLRHGDDMLTAADTAITEVNSLLIEASAIASQNLSNLTSAAEREAEADLVAGIREQLLVVGNRTLNGRYIFAGRDTTAPPFVNELGGVGYTGDSGYLYTRISEDFSASTNVPGNLLFGALSSQIASNVDLTPTLTADLRLEDIDGTRGQSIRGGTLIINEFGGAGSVNINLDQVDTLGDIVDAINNGASAAGAGFSAVLSDTGITIEPGGNEITVVDANAGVVASNLGVLTQSPTTDTIEGLALTARVSTLTPIANLAGGAGIDLENGLVITNGELSTTVDLSGAETVQDLIRAINNTGSGVIARVNDAGNGIDVFNRVSGTYLSIGENGGTTAADLGIRTFNAGTPLTSLNFGRGVEMAQDRTDFSITAKDGSVFEVDIFGAETIADVVARINDAASEAGVAVEASLVDVGNGIRLTDNTGGSGELLVTPLGTSLAAVDLGLADARAVGDDNVLVGSDVALTRTDGILGALVELERALRSDDTQAISAAGQRIDEFVPEVTRVHGVIGAQAQAMQSKLRQTEDAAGTTEVFLSELRDLDYAEAATRLQAAITQTQASFQTGSVLFNLSLLDYLQ